MSEPVTGDWHAGAALAAPAEWPSVPGFDILSELGRGGMGVVYKARQHAPDRLVALKMIRDGALAGPNARARFRTEADAAARLEHPNVVRIYEIGESAGRPYLAMELVEGGTLDRHLNGRSLPARDAASLLRTLALAVAHAHERRIVHRDLKPANILLAGDRSQRTGDSTAETGLSSLSPVLCLLSPKVSDFGLAKRLDPEATACTQDGAILGTPSYMAPEQAAGNARDVGPAADVYSLGAILYELLTGRPPFTGDSWEEIVRRVRDDEPDSPTRLRPDVPRDLDTVCLKCLEKEPSRRYPSANELADDLGRFLDGRPVLAVPPNSAERLARLAAREGYAIIGEVGRGPHGIVYQARHGPLHQPVALKVFAAGICSREEWDARLSRAAELRPALAHPHVVAVQGAGWWDNSPYLAFEYVSSGSLANALGGRPHPLRESLKLVAQLTELVGFLHRQGVVHGNLKPGNVLLAADGIPRVTDLSLTGGLLPAADRQPASLAYRAPELLGEPSAEPRPHTDVYGLGVILYELLTGRPPFSGATADEVLEQVRTREPDPPSRTSTYVSPALDALCLRCLRKNPWRRFPRAYDFLIRLREFLDDGGRSGRKPPGPSS